MLTSLPQARIVRTAGQQVAAPPRPPEPMSDRTREILGVIAGFWPLIAVCLFTMGFFVLASIASAP